MKLYRFFKVIKYSILLNIYFKNDFVFNNVVLRENWGCVNKILYFKFICFYVRYLIILDFVKDVVLI